VGAVEKLNDQNQVRPAARRKARRFVMQALYQWQLAGGNPTDIEAQFRTDNNMCKTDVAYFHDLLHNILPNLEETDRHLASALDRKITDLGQIELAILRIGAYELAHRIDVPYRVVINEGIELAKTFAAQDSYKFVNGILDKLSKNLRSVEIE
jgi:N utilization substance protein B